MKNIGLLGMLILILLSGCTGIKKADKIVMDTKKVKYENYNLSEIEKKKGYFFIEDKIVFVLDKKANLEIFESECPENMTIKKVYLAGTFNNWSGGESNWKMVKSNKEERWFLEKSIKEVSVPGNSGKPEYKFYLTGTYTRNGKEKLTEVWILPSKDLEVGYKFNDQWTGGYNYLVLFEGDSVEELAKKEAISRKIKTEYKTKEAQANFREVLIGKIAKNKVYRSYHPFIPSRNTDKSKADQEKKRMELVRNMIEENQIKSVINLTDGEELYNDPRVSDYYKKLLNDKKVLFAKTKYSIVFHQSNSEKFQGLIKKVVTFLGDAEMPVLVHCRLGSDRTGVVSAFIAAANGATWEEIAFDFDRTNDLRMGEYRDTELLKYSVENMLNIKIESKKQNFEKEIKDYMQNKIGLDEETINRFYENVQN